MKNEAQLLATLKRAFHSAYGNSHSSFYRDMYARQGFIPKTDFPKNIEEWRAIPFTRKEDIVSTPFMQRLFLPYEEIRTVRTSSGTSKRGVTLVPRSRILSRRYYKRFTDRAFFFYLPHLSPDMSFFDAKIAYVGGDPTNLPASAKLAALMSVEAIGSSPSLLAVFIPHLIQEMDTRKIKLLEFYGERLSELQHQLFRDIFPNALFYHEYSNSETHGQCALTCDFQAKEKRNHIHPQPDAYYWELIDQETGEVIDEPEREGEIVLTTLWEHDAFPGLRYRTGDLAQLKAEPCPCGNPVTYETLGRASFDRAAIPGGEIRGQELERAMQAFSGKVQDDYELHIYDERHENTIRPTFTFYVTVTDPSVTLEEIARTVPSELRISPIRTLVKGIESGLYGSFICAPPPEEKFPGRRQTRIVRHAT